MSINDRRPSRILLVVAMLLLALVSLAAEAAVARAYPVVPVLSGLPGSPGRILVSGSNATRPNPSGHLLILPDGGWTPLATRVSGWFSGASRPPTTTIEMLFCRRHGGDTLANWYNASRSRGR